ncbi:MAG TPA: hypothetical protein V6C95_06465 [Coleofasciculaceae cyanobacterium]
MEELRADLSESIERFDFLLESCQERILGEFFSHLLKSNRISVTILLFAVKSALLAHDSNLISIVRAIEETEAANAVVSKGGKQ